jgi:hypothetical protein
VLLAVGMVEGAAVVEDGLEVVVEEKLEGMAGTDTDVESISAELEGIGRDAVVWIEKNGIVDKVVE